MKRRTRPLPKEALMSAESTSHTPLLPENQLTPALYQNAYYAKDIRGVSKRARELVRDNDFVGTFHHVRTCYFADGLRYAGEGASAKGGAKLAKWEERTGFRPVLDRLAADTWREFLMCDNAVAFWMKPEAGGALPSVVILDCEVVNYTNRLGIDVLKIKPGRTALTDAEKEKMDPRWVKAYASGGEITVDPAKGECFRVLTWEKLGNGLLMPRLKALLEKLSTRDLLSTADWLGAWESRNITELWTAGHETRYGKDAGTKKNFITAAIQKAMEAALKNKVGGRRVIANFDVKAAYAYLEAKYFDPMKFASVMTHLETWGGAAVQMAKVGAATPGLMNAFAAEGRKCREMVAGFIAGIVNSEDFHGGARPPVRIEVAWNPDSFLDAKLLLEKLRLAHGSGAMSTETARESLALDHEREGDRLAAEKKNPGRVSPTFEKAQGMSTPGKPGRPATDVVPPEPET